MAARLAFKNEQFERAIKENGYFIMPLLSQEEVDQCLKLYNETNSSLDDKFYNTLASRNLDYRQKIQEGLDKILNEKVRNPFLHYTPLAYNFAAKSSGDDSDCKLHCDDSHTDESIHLCVNIWIPLVDVNDGNGSLQILPKSHLLPAHTRGIGLPFAFDHLTELIMPRLLTLQMKAGEALFFDPKIIHGSQINTTQTDRPAIILAMLPDEATPMTYVRVTKVGKCIVTLFETPPSFFVDLMLGEIPIGYKAIESMEYVPLEIDAETFLSIIEH